ncbi:hypothetical protein B9G99_00315 [Kushneria konosiri]|uniref:Uncharacterized protein n=1 Tax=Kushneria konosiri TaxID=698828 RepID=A0A2Z2H330_9GAMM|nr:hypothetical protein B9G99_00315 [Kushneria konosiri]
MKRDANPKGFLSEDNRFIRDSESRTEPPAHTWVSPITPTVADLDKVLVDTAKELDCQPVDEEILFAIHALKKERDELQEQLTASEEHIRGFPSFKAINDRDRRIQTETLDELIDSLTEVGGEITINGIQGYRDALARGDA